MCKEIWEYLSFSFLLLTTIGTAQNTIDSLQRKSYDELKNVYYKYRDTDSILAHSAIMVYSKRAKKDNNIYKMADSFLYYSLRSIEKDKMSYLDSIIALTRANQNKKYPAYAYFAKAQYFLYKKRDIKKTLKNLDIAKKYAAVNDNNSLLHRIDYHIGIVKSEHLNEKEEALKIFKRCANFYAKEIEYEHKYHLMFTLNVMAETYIALKKYDSASYINHFGYRKSYYDMDNEVKEMMPSFTLCEGINQYEQQNYEAAIDSINIALPKMIFYDDKSNIIDSFFYLGKSYYDLNNKKKGVYYFKKTDSLLETLNSIPKYKHVKTYEYLKDYYKAKNDIKNQNKYLDKLNTVLDKYLNDRVFISMKVREDYDVPLLLDEQEALINKLNNKTSNYLFSIALLLLLLIISGGMIYYQYKKKQVYRIRFEKLMATEKITTSPENDVNSSIVTKKNALKIPEKQVQHILAKLDEFEKEQQYLIVGISSQSLANDMETNVKYLSKIINYYKNQSFTTYLNELRINYAVKELKENEMLRKFTIKAIANEVGYNNAETFSNAFYKKIKIKPSYYIKELEKQNFKKDNT